MHSPEVEKALLTGEWTEETAAEWDADEDPIIAEIRRHRQEIIAKFDHDWERYRKHLLVLSYACGTKVVSSDWRDPHGPREVELPADLTGLIPNRKDFIRSVRLSRGVEAEYQPDLEAYNEDARRRAVVLGFPPETFVIRPDQFPSDWKDERDAEEKLAEPQSGVTEPPEATASCAAHPDRD
jgi:hypothetical protein